MADALHLLYSQIERQDCNLLAVITLLLCVSQGLTPARAPRSEVPRYSLVDQGSSDHDGATFRPVGLDLQGHPFGTLTERDTKKRSVSWQNGGRNLLSVDLMPRAERLSRMRLPTTFATDAINSVTGASETARWPLEFRAANEKGEAVGLVRDAAPGSPSPDQTHAVVWKRGEITILPDMGGVNEWANDINSRGQIVGSGGLGKGEPKAALWQDNFLYDLNETLTNGDGWRLEEACGINDAGQIVGLGVHKGARRLFLLIPIPPKPRPEPSRKNA